MRATRPTGKMHASHELGVSVVSPEEAEFGSAEFWAGERLFASTRLEDSELALRTQPPSDGGAAVVSAHSLAEALAREAAPRIPVNRTTPTLLGESLLGPDQCPDLLALRRVTWKAQASEV
jgi:hypothetical protein